MTALSAGILGGCVFALVMLAAPTYRAVRFLFDHHRSTKPPADS